MRFVECATLHDYAMRAAAADGPIPYLACPERWRLDAWRRVLKTHYIARPGTTRTCASTTAGPVIAVGPDFDAVARALALRLNVPCLSPTMADLLTGRGPLFEHPATFVGSPRDLNTATARVIATNAQANWTLITGWDLAAASFVAAKSLALYDERPWPQSWAVLDAIGNRVFEHDSEGACQDHGPISAADLARQMGDGLVVHAHGEGAHADLGRAVLCGRVGEEERDLRGAPVLGGCRRGPGEGHCKRRAPRHERLATFADLHTRRLVFLTCNGYSPNGELYPSNLSGPLCALEGAVAEVVTTLRPCAFPPGLPQSCAALLATGLDLAALPEFLASRAQPGAREAFVRIGGIATARAARRRNAATNQVKTPRRLLTQARRLAALHARAERWGARFQSRSKGSRRLARHLSRLRSASVQVAGVAGCAETAVVATRLAIEIPDLENVLDQLRTEALARWDAAFAAVLSALEIDFDPRNDLHGGWTETRRLLTALCERCAGPLEAQDWRLPFVVLGAATAIECLNCGLRDLWWDGEAPLEVFSPSIIEPGQMLTICVERTRPARDRSETAWLLAQLRDKGAGAVLNRTTLRFSGDRANLHLSVPDDCRPDLHTLKLIWVENMSLAVARRRIVCVRRTGGDPSCAAMKLSV